MRALWKVQVCTYLVHHQTEMTILVRLPFSTHRGCLSRPHQRCLTASRCRLVWNKFLVIIHTSITCTHRPRTHRSGFTTIGIICLLSLSYKTHPHTFGHFVFTRTVRRCLVLRFRWWKSIRNSHLHSGTPKTSSVCPIRNLQLGEASKQTNN